MNKKELESYVVQLRNTEICGKPMPEAQIADTLGVSIGIVSRILKRAASGYIPTREEEEMILLWDISSGEAREDILVAFLTGHPAGLPLSFISYYFKPVEEVNRCLRKLEAEGHLGYALNKRLWRI